MAAARLADVDTGNPHPLVLGRRRQHLPQQLAVALLQLVAPAQRGAGIRNPLGKGVPHALQLAEIGDPRGPCHSGNPGVYREPREGLSRKSSQLPLEASDLAPQLSPRQPLIASDA